MRTLAPLAPTRRRVTRTALAILLTLGCTIGLAFPAAQAAVDPSISVTNGGVNAIVADGRTLFVGGSVTRVGPATGSGVPVSAASFAPLAGYPRVVGQVSAVAPDGAGGWYIAGAFTFVGGVVRHNLAHVTAANGVDSWSPSVDALVLAMVVTPTDVILGGTFTTVNAVARPRLARISRSTGLVAPWTPAPSDRITTLATDGTTLYVGGWFDGIALAARAGLAAFTLASDALTPWDPAATASSGTPQIHTLALGNGYVYVGGNFIHIGGKDRAIAAALLPATGAATAWNPSAVLPGSVTQLLPFGDRVILTADVAAPGGIAAADTASGARFPRWEPSLFPPQGSLVHVRTLAALNGRIAVGGSFVINSHEVGLFTGNLAVFDTSSSVPLVAPEPPGDVWALAAQGSALYVGGQFTSLNPGTCRNLVAIDAGTGQPASWLPDATHTGAFGGLGTVTAVAADATRVYAVVTFIDPVSGSNRSQVRAFSRTDAALVWQAECDQVVNALAVRNGVLYAGGSFSSLNGAKQNLAALDAATGALQPWAPAPNTSVRALLAAPGALVVGGDFAAIGGQSRARLAQVDYASGNATGWNPGADNAVWALARSGTTLYAGGDFATAGGQPRAHVAALDLGANAALPWNPGANAQVLALAADGVSVYAGGGFTTFAGQPASRFAAVNGASGTPLAWGASANGPVEALALANAHVFLGGLFGAVDTQPLSGLAGVFDPSLLAVGLPLPPPATRLAVGPSPLRGDGHASFTLAHDAAVWLRVFDVSGRVARTLMAGERCAAGVHTLALVRAGLAPGVYHVRLDAGGEPAAARFIVLP